MNNDTEHNNSNRDYGKLVETIRTRVHRFFNERISALFEKADDTIFKKGEAASSIAEQNTLFEFMNVVRRQRAAHKARFASEISAYLLPLSNSSDLPNKKKKQGDDFQLGLIEQDEMDEMVVLTTLSSKAAMDMQEELSHLEIRLEALADETQHIFHKNALAPNHICDAFQATLASTDYTGEQKQILYNLFGEEVTRNLKELIDDINQLLIDHDILPDIKFKHGISKSEHRPRPSEQRPDENTAEYGTPPRAGGAGSGYAQSGGSGDASWSGDAGGGNAAGSGGPGQSAGSGYDAQGGGAGRSDGSAAPGGAGGQNSAAQQGTDSGQMADATEPGTPGQRYSAGMPAQQIQDRIRNFVGALPTEAGTASGGEGASGGGGSYYSHQDVVDALTNMQTQTQIDPEQTHQFDAAAIKNAVLSTIGQQQGGAVTKRVNQISEKTIDFIKLIFDAIIEDDTITDAIKTLILSLQIPVIKTAMIDDEFFIDDQRPSRQLLDKLAEAGVGINSHHDVIYIELEKIIKKLLNDFVDNLDAFEIALNEVIALFEETTQQAEEQEENTRTELIHAHARNIVLSEIRKITLGKKLPINVHALVLKAWPTLMFNHYLKHGKGNDEWIELLMMLATITESVQPVKSIQELEALGISHDDIVNAVREKLKDYHKPREFIDKIIDDLEETYAELLETRDLPEQEELDEEEKEPEQSYVPSVEEQKEEVDQVKQKLARLPDIVRPGSWFKVYNGEDSIARRLKLGIILVQDATLAFVDYKGSVILEKDAGVFAEELESGRSELIMQHSVFDRALSSALDNAEQAPA